MFLPNNLKACHLLSKLPRRMGGNMTGAVKKIDKSKKGMSDNPRVQKALKKANEEDELEEKLETQRCQTSKSSKTQGSRMGS